MGKSGSAIRIADIVGNRRMRRRRAHDWSRRLIRETHLHIDDLIWPLFIVEGEGVREPVASMPGVFRLSVDEAVKAAREAVTLGIPAILPFPNVAMNLRDERGSEALNVDNLICRFCREVKEKGLPLGVITDAALDPFTSHGHDGVMEGETIVNDATVELLVQQSIVQAQAGADIISPSDMMDGRVGAIRQGLDATGFSDVQIMAYSAKYASSIYTPFREAVGSQSALKGDKKTYQMDYANAQEALHEVALDIDEGADMVMVKPGLFYLDIVRQVKDNFSFPTFAYQVSGEYSMIMAAAQNGWLDETGVMMESLTAFKRAGADGILTYFAPMAAKILQE